MGVWLCMDYSQTLLHYILPVPHYILQMSSQYWEGEGGRGLGTCSCKLTGHIIGGGGGGGGGGGEKGWREAFTDCWW